MADSTRPDDEIWLVLRAQSGETRAFDELLKTVQLPLSRYILSIVRNSSIAEDVLQEVLMRIYKKLRWLKDAEVFRSWAYQIATRESFRHLKREKLWSGHVRDESVLEGIVDSTPPTQTPLELAEEFSRLVADLSPASRAVIVLFYQHDMTIEETASILEIPIGTAKSRLAYGLETLRRKSNSQIAT
jgi:RNA polymerase sigma-70 factor (ECF subfamily)